MNHKNAILVAAAIIAAVSLTASALALPQQVMAGGHRHHNNGIKVDQQISQANLCSNQSTCVNQADNTFGPPQLLPVWR
jgi:hypothetical protein